MTPRLQAITIVANHYHVVRDLTPAAAERVAARRVRDWSDREVLAFLGQIAAEAYRAQYGEAA